VPESVCGAWPSTGTDVFTYLGEGWGFNTFISQGGTVYHAYSAADRGVEFLMSYYEILDRAPKGRDERDGFQLWIRRHDEYDHRIRGREHVTAQRP
jgi:predicted dithiol-disulfide oxidoreductase (DUF899 family)